MYFCQKRGCAEAGVGHGWETGERTRQTAARRVRQGQDAFVALMAVAELCLSHVGETPGV